MDEQLSSPSSSSSAAAAAATTRSRFEVLETSEIYLDDVRDNRGVMLKNLVALPSHTLLLIPRKAEIESPKSHWATLFESSGSKTKSSSTSPRKGYEISALRISIPADAHAGDQWPSWVIATPCKFIRRPGLVHTLKIPWIRSKQCQSLEKLCVCLFLLPR